MTPKVLEQIHRPQEQVHNTKVKREPLVERIVGGFFELEFPRQSGSYHPDAYSYTSGRACLGVILDSLKVKKVYLPFYCCDALLQPLRRRNIAFEYYGLNEKLEFDPSIALQSGEVILYINYFGLKMNFIRLLSDRYGSQLIIDNTHAFFETAQERENYWSFNSARKFFGVPDGAYLYASGPVETATIRNSEMQYTHLVERILGNQAKAYKHYLDSETNITDSPYQMSLLSERILSGIDYGFVKSCRLENFEFFQRHLADINRLQFDGDGETIPFCYPLLLDTEIDKQQLFQNHIYIPTYWPNILQDDTPDFLLERQFAQRLLPLPIDHRYNGDACEHVLKVLKSILAGQAS
jgi:hypothetical protein